MAITNLGAVSMSAGGVYNSETVYKKYKVVSANGGSYMYINPVPAAGVPVTDTSHWQQIASRGLQGDVTEDQLNAAKTEAFLPVKSGEICSIEMPDGNSDVTHPGVVYVPKKWNGHQYWMAITGMPETRENPCVFYSDDGMTWVAPEGLTNPVFSLAWAVSKGFSYNSDTSLLLIDDVLWMLFRSVDSSGYRESVWLSKSSDGVTWSDPSVALFSATTDMYVRNIVSPSMVILPTSGDLAIFTVNYTNAASGIITLEKRISSDAGETWGSPTSCVIPEIFNFSPLLAGIWHIDVQSRGGHLHALCYAQTGKLHYFESFDDGNNWHGSISPVFGNDHSPTTFFYRSAFQPSASGDGWDIWASDWTAKRVRLFRNINLSVGAPDLAKNRGIWLSAQSFSSAVGSLTTWFTSGNGRLFGWRLAENALGRVVSSFMRPVGWKRLRFTLFWINDGVGEGNVKFRAISASYSPGDIPLSIGATHDSQGQSKIITAAASGTMMRTVMGVPGTDNTAGDYTIVMVERGGDEGTDTLENRILFLGALVEPC